MAVRTADAEWTGSLKDGEGKMRFGGGAFDGRYSFGSRFEEAPGTNPEELIAAAHSGCFSMALAGVLGKAGLNPESIATTARVHLEKVGEGFGVTRIELDTVGRVPGTDQATFEQHAEDARKNCPISRLLTGAEITVKARLAS